MRFFRTLLHMVRLLTHAKSIKEHVSGRDTTVSMGKARNVIRGGGPGIPEWAFRLKN